MILTCATDEFQQFWNNAIFENCVKNLSFEIIQMFHGFFRWLDQFVTACILILLKVSLKKLFSSKTLIFAFLTQKLGSERKLFQNTT